MLRKSICLLLPALAAWLVLVGLAQAQVRARAKAKPPAAGRLGAKPTGGGPAPQKADEPTPATVEKESGPALPSGQPGESKLTGPQTPSLVVEKIAPPEVQVGKAAKFEVRVRNTGTAAVHNVEIHDEAPAGAELLGTQPEAKAGPQGKLIWTLGDLAPGEEKIVSMELMPTEEGEIGSLATVHFSAEATSRSKVTRPVLKLEVLAPREVLIGEDVRVLIKLSNSGTGPASGLVLTEVLPVNCAHEEGTELEQDVGTLKPGESREFDLVIRAAKAGNGKNLVHVAGDGSLAVSRDSMLTVLAPELELSMQGPRRRYLERQAVYTVAVKNPGTAPARDVEVTTYLPKGLKFVAADNQGQYDPQTRSVRWSLAELAVNQSGKVTLKTMPVEAGEQKLRIEGQASRGLQVVEEQSVLIEGVAATLFEVTDVADPIEVGEETEYEIRVANQGSKDASQVTVTVVLPVGLKAVSADGPAKHSIAGQTVQFGPLARLAPKADETYRVTVKGVAAGDQRVKVQFKTAELKTPVTEEESTRVYSDSETGADDEESAAENGPTGEDSTGEGPTPADDEDLGNESAESETDGSQAAESEAESTSNSRRSGASGRRIRPRDE